MSYKGQYNNTARAKTVSNRQRRRDAARAIEMAQRTHGVLLTVLGQAGGEIIVQDGTIEKIGAKLFTLDWVVVPGTKPGEHIIRMVEGGTADQDEHEVPPAAAGSPLAGNPSTDLQDPVASTDTTLGAP